MITTENFFETGATLHHDAPSYIERAADQELQAALLRGEFCYVLTSRQMGKSSLLVRTASRLRQQGVQVVTIDLAAIGQNLLPQQWYDGLSLPVGYQLHLEDPLEDFMARNEWLGPAQRLFTALREVVLKVCPGPVIFFIDEIDTVCSLPFSTDEFFAAVRECYNRRVEDPAFNRITFALFGVATPSELMRDSRVTPFNIGRRIELNDFTEAEAARFAEGLSHQSNLIERVYHWSHGHPYLTQRLCQGIVSDRTILTPGDVDRLSEDLFLSNRVRERDPNLVFVREKILRAPHDLAALLKLYKRIRHQERVYDDENNPLINVLRLSGITRVDKNLLVVRNRLYYRVFDRDWVRAHLPQAPETNTIAVLPFVDLSPERTHEYLADGLADELISALGKYPGLKVASRTSAFQFKGKNEDIQKIGNQLMVQHLVEGSIRVAGSTLQLSVRAIQAAEGHCLWQNTFKYSMTELERAAEDVARDIIRQLQGGAGASPDTTPAIRFREDAGVYNLYLQGRFFWNKRTEPALQRSINLFEEAVRKDPQNALAYSGLADAYNILGIYNYLRPADAYPKAKAAAVQALEWDDNLAQAHCALGCTSAVYDWDWRRAEHEFLRAIELNPSYAVAHQWYAINCLTPLGRHDEAVAALHRAYEVDPLSIHITTSIALTFYFAGAYDEALRQCRHVVDLEPGFWLNYLFLGWTCAQTRQFEEALGAFQNAVKFSGRDPVALAGLSYGYAVAGKPAEARALIEELLHGSPGVIPAIELVILYAALGEVEPAMQWLERACDERSVKMIYLKVDPKLSPLRCHPGFASYLTRIGVQSDSYED